MRGDIGKGCEGADWKSVEEFDIFEQNEGDVEILQSFSSENRLKLITVKEVTEATPERKTRYVQPEL